MFARRREVYLHTPLVGRNDWQVRLERLPSTGRDETVFAKPVFPPFDGLDYLAGARQALLEKFACELSRIGGDNFVDGFLHGSRIPLA